MTYQELREKAAALVQQEKALISAHGQDSGLAELTQKRNEALSNLETTLAKCNASAADDPTCQRVLVAVDDSEPANWALQIAVGLARRHAARVGLIHVIHSEMSMAPIYAMEREDLCESHRQAGHDVLSRFQAMIPIELQVEPVLRVGEPAREIVQSAREWKADLIVLGTHGRVGVPHMLVGSTAEAVVRLAHCPVLTVGHDPAETRACCDSRLLDACCACIARHERRAIVHPRDGKVEDEVAAHVDDG